MRCPLLVLALIGPALAAAAPMEEAELTVIDKDATPEHRFDHLVVGISELEVGIEQVATLTGVRAVFGGVHPHTGTHNALASLGADSYLEIVAPRPDADGSSPLATWVATIEQPTPILWAISTSDAAATRARLERAGFTTSEPTPGSRQTPDGGVLEWKVFGLAEPQLAAAPFFIEWSAATTHPATTSPEGCSLTRLAVTSNDNEAMRRLLGLLDVDPEVVDGPQPALRAELSCPKGTVELGPPAG